MSSFIPLSTILWSKQWNKTLQKSSSSATPFDDLFSINNVNFGNCISAIYLSELELKDTSTSSTEMCYLDTNIKTGDATTLFRISIYDKRDDFAFGIGHFSHMDSNIPANPAYGFYISQLVRYARICTSKVDFINRLRGLSLSQTTRLWNQSTWEFINKFVNRHGLIVEKYSAGLREMRLAIQAWIASSYPYIAYLLLAFLFQLYLGTCAHAI